MTATLTRAHARTAKQEWRGHVLALVLFAVLAWYTVVSPSYTAAPPRSTGGDAPDAEERDIETQAAGVSLSPRVARSFAPRRDEFEIAEEEELDWPEIIGDD